MDETAPVSTSGRAAGWLALAALLTFGLSATLSQFTELPGPLRLLLGLTFLGSGVAALATSARAIQLGDRRPAVWAALGVGVLTAALLVAEFTVME